ncbi:BrnT family toxin [Dyadobacter aurulentus]|uniref:BrnT family toxin n=1 Tax=Dyadobacter sp. UC 10 TaxID=2605428 RepID=UPI001788D813
MAPLKFIWDTGNKSKSEEKHCISNLEAESIFKDPAKLVIISNRSREVRFLCIGRSYLSRMLTSYFIIRDGKVRIIGTRAARQKEKEMYNKRG